MRMMADYAIFVLPILLFWLTTCNAGEFIVQGTNFMTIKIRRQSKNWFPEAYLQLRYHFHSTVAVDMVRKALHFVYSTLARSKDKTCVYNRYSLFLTLSYISPTWRVIQGLYLRKQEEILLLPLEKNLEFRI